jgi:hypothetical protein
LHKYFSQLKPASDSNLDPLPQSNAANSVEQQLSLQELESPLQEGPNQKVTLQMSLEGVDVAQQQQQQQQPFQLEQQQQQVALRKQALQRSGAGGNAQSVKSSLQSAPSSVQNAGQQQQPVSPVKLFGVGILFASDNYGGQVVRSFVPGGPAERSGQVDIGDVIVRVDNRDVFGLPLDYLEKYLLGPSGSTISMGFCKQHDKTVRNSAISVSVYADALHFAGSHQPCFDHTWHQRRRRKGTVSAAAGDAAAAKPRQSSITPDCLLCILANFTRLYFMFITVYSRTTTAGCKF